LYRLNQSRGGECFPLDVANWASTWNCQLDAEVKAGAACAEAEDFEGGPQGGMYSHMFHAIFLKRT
jgi:hypothetical protein